MIPSARRIRKWGIQHCSLNRVHLQLDACHQFVKAGAAQMSRGHQLVRESYDRIASSRLITVFFRPVVLDVPVVVTPETWNAALDQCRASALSRSIGCSMHGISDHQWVGTVNRDPWHTVAVGPLRDAVYLVRD